MKKTPGWSLQNPTGSRPYNNPNAFTSPSTHSHAPTSKQQTPHTPLHECGWPVNAVWRSKTPCCRHTMAHRQCGCKMARPRNCGAAGGTGAAQALRRLSATCCREQVATRIPRALGIFGIRVTPVALAPHLPLVSWYPCLPENPSYASSYGSRHADRHRRRNCFSRAIHGLALEELGLL